MSFNKLLSLITLLFLLAGSCTMNSKRKSNQFPQVKKVGEYNILLGGFHDHWKRTGQDNPALLLAALDYYHYDFMCLMGGDSILDPMTKKGIENYSGNKKIYLGKEMFYGWGHVVTVRNNPKGVNLTNPNFRAEMLKLKQGGGFVAMAHPASHPESNRLIVKTGELDSMLALGLIDAVQPELEPSEIEWINRRNAEEKPVPVICGWDIHYINDLPNLPPVLYSKKQTPFGHLDSGGRYRNIIIGAENNFESIIEAVKDGRSVIEDLRDGESCGKLYGEDKWVNYLIKHGYKKLISELDNVRDSKTLTVDKERVKVGEPLTLTFSEPCRVQIPGSMTTPKEFKTDKNGVLHIDKMPAMLDKNLTFYPVAAFFNDGTEKDFAIALHHKYTFDVYPLYKNNRYFLRVKLSEKLSGNLFADVEGEEMKTQPFNSDKVLVDISALKINFKKPVSFKIKITDNDNISRVVESYVNYNIAPKFAGDWNGIPGFFLNSAEQEVAKGYGTTRPYPGPDVFSAEIKFAWTDEYFMMRAKVVDKINFNPFISSKGYQGDVIQLGIDPMLRRNHSLGNVHAFNLSLTPEGPMLWRWKSAVDEKCAGYKPFDEDFSMGDKYLKITKWENGIIYDLKLPWNQLAPVKPEKGKQMGVFMIVANNDGDGFLEMFGWPKELPNGGYLKPYSWGFLELR